MLTVYSEKYTAIQLKGYNQHIRKWCGHTNYRCTWNNRNHEVTMHIHCVWHNRNYQATIYLHCAWHNRNHKAAIYIHSTMRYLYTLDEATSSPVKRCIHICRKRQPLWFYWLNRLIDHWLTPTDWRLSLIDLLITVWQSKSHWRSQSNSTKFRWRAQSNHFSEQYNTARLLLPNTINQLLP